MSTFSGFPEDTFASMRGAAARMISRIRRTTSFIGLSMGAHARGLST
jgi:hypothetical protein